MKLVASASYDYMKLMVVELQQQLEEIEERERSLAANETEAEQPNPELSSKNRTNPFNNQKVKSNKTWNELHRQYGVQILKDQKTWAVDQPDLSQ